MAPMVSNSKSKNDEFEITEKDLRIRKINFLN